MATSLLDFAMQSRRGAGGGILGRLPTSSEMLRASVLGRGQTNSSRVNPPTGAQPTVPQQDPNAPHPAQVRRPNRADMRRPPDAIPQQALPNTEPVSGPSDGERQFQGIVANMVARAAGGDFPSGAERGVRELTRDAGRRTAGQSGSVGFLGKLLGLDSFPGLTEAQTGRLKSGGLITLGAAIGAREPGTPVWQAINKGLLLARADTAESAGEILDLRRAGEEMQKRAEIFDNENLTPIEKWEEFRRQAAVSGNLKAAELANENIELLRDLDGGMSEGTLEKINGQDFIVQRRPDGTMEIRDPFTNKIVDERPEGTPEVNPTRLNQLEREFDKSRQDALTAAQALGDARAIRGKLETEDTVSSADQRVLANRLQQMMDAGNVRESTIEAIASSGGVQGGIQGLVGLFNEGAAPATVARDLIQAIERGAQQQRVAFNENRQTFAQRLLNVPGISEDQVRASLGVDPFARFAGGSSTSTNTPTLFPEDEEGQ